MPELFSFAKTFAIVNIFLHDKYWKKLLFETRESQKKSEDF